MGSFQSEVIANYIYRRVCEEPELLKIFASDESIEGFWKIPSNEQRKIWGKPLNVTKAVKARFNRYL